MAMDTSGEKVSVLSTSLFNHVVTFDFYFLGLISRLERATRFDLNGDNIIGRRPDVYYGYYGMPTYGIPYGFARYGGMYGYTRPYF